MSDLNRQRKKISRDKTELYRHFDTAGRLLYVGISVNSPSRLCAHRREAAWADQIVTITIERFPTRREALDAEIRAIQTEKPLHNQAGRMSGFFRTGGSTQVPKERWRQEVDTIMAECRREART